LGKEAGGVGELFEIAAYDEAAEGFDSVLLDVGAITDGEDKGAALEAGISAEDGDNAGIVGRKVTRVRPGHAELDSGIADVQDVEGDDFVLGHCYLSMAAQL
jgi:orotidine-5'-phosphate decarboxylase